MRSRQGNSQTRMFRSNTSFNFERYPTQGTGRAYTHKHRRDDNGYQRYPQPQQNFITDSEYDDYPQEPIQPQKVEEVEQDPRSQKIKETQIRLWNSQMSLACLPGNIPMCYVYLNKYAITDYNVWSNYWNSIHTQASTVWANTNGQKQTRGGNFTWGVRPSFKEGELLNLCDPKDDEKFYVWIWRFILANIAPFNNLREKFENQAGLDTVEQAFGKQCEEAAKSLDRQLTQKEIEDEKNTFSESLGSEDLTRFKLCIALNNIQEAEPSDVCSYFKDILTFHAVSPNELEEFYNQHVIINLKTCRFGTKHRHNKE